MNAERLLIHYERIADAPDAISSLRRFVLDLAVRGMLVPQDAGDEPAPELLKRIAAVKARLVSLGAIRKPKMLPPVHRDDIPVDDISGWIWIRLGDVSTLITKGSTPTSYGHAYTMEGVNFVKVESIKDGLLQPENITSFIGNETHDFLARSQLAAGDILFSIAGSIGTCAVVTDRVLPANTNQALAIIRGTQTVFHSEFLLKSLQSSINQSVLAKARGGAMHNVSLEDIQNFVVPLPPLAEQHRIVAKVNELMALCDRLEAARAGREGIRDGLSAASLARLNAPDPETFQGDTRFVLAALPALTTRGHQIKQLRQTILNLAVRGKLMPQDPYDEPASELLKRIAAEKQRMVKEEQLKKEKPLRETQPDQWPFELPNQWEWVRLDYLAQKITDGEHLSPNKTTSGMPLLTAMHVTAKGLTLKNPQFVSMEDGCKFRSRCDPRRGDILICSRGTIGRCAVVDVDDIFCLMGSVILVRLPPECLPWYFNHFLSTDRAQEQLRGMSGATAVQALYLKDIRLCPMPLPPLAEQHRIVTKVDALMTLCDRLEANVTAVAAARRRLLDALLHEALAPADGAVSM